MPSRSSKVFDELDADGNKSLEHTEMAEFIASQDKLWAKLSTKLKQPKEKATKAATLVAMELATGLKGELALNFALTRDQFKRFYKEYVQDPEGSEEFFQRAVFACFDEDNSGELDDNELDAFLDAVYETRDVRKGKISLYSKDQMKALILEKHDADGGGTLDFKEIRDVMRADAKALGKLKENQEESGEALPEVKPSTDTRAIGQQATGQTTMQLKKNSTAVAYPNDDDFCAWLERRMYGTSTGTMCGGLGKKCVIS